MSDYSFNTRILVLNAMAAFIAAGTLRMNRGRSMNGVMRMIKNTAVGYLLGAAFIVPEIYYKRMIYKKDKEEDGI